MQEMPETLDDGTFDDVRHVIEIKGGPKGARVNDGADKRQEKKKRRLPPLETAHGFRSVAW
jgi:hypothetical protein